MPNLYATYGFGDQPSIDPLARCEAARNTLAINSIIIPISNLVPIGVHNHSANEQLTPKLEIPLDKYERSFYFVVMTKGDETKRSILDTALNMASRLSLESVTIGALAKATKMSKSGLFAHFQSKENLQIEILKFAAADFVDHVIIPALKQKAGIPRIKALVDNWIQWGARLKGGCIFVSASTEFSERPGKVRDYLLYQQEEWIQSLKKMAQSAIRVHDFRDDIDCDQFAFDLYSLLLGYHQFHILLRHNASRQRQKLALDRLIRAYQ